MALTEKQKKKLKGLTPEKMEKDREIGAEKITVDQRERMR